jgi:hydrogenase nickel incorporation protein HypA/HybF
MHELPIAEIILEIATRHARQNGAGRIVAIHLVIGQLSSYLDESIRFYWDLIARDTLAEGAVLHFQRLPAELQCRLCGHRYGLASQALACPQCGSSQVDVLQGEEFTVEAIEIGGTTGQEREGQP